MKVLAWVEKEALGRIREADPISAEVMQLKTDGPSVFVARIDLLGREPKLVNDVVARLAKQIDEHTGRKGVLLIFVQPDESIEAVEGELANRIAQARAEGERRGLDAFRAHLAHPPAEIMSVGGFDPRKHCARCSGRVAEGR